MDCMYTVEGKYVTESNDYGIPSNDEDGVDDAAVKVINVIAAHSLTPTTISKKEYQVWLKGYMQQVTELLKNENPDRVASFQKEAVAAAKFILGNFKDFDFYMGASNAAEGQIIPMGYGDDGMSPTFYIWKDGLIEEY